MGKSSGVHPRFTSTPAAERGRLGICLAYCSTVYYTLFGVRPRRAGAAVLCYKSAFAPLPAPGGALVPPARRVPLTHPGPNTPGQLPLRTRGELQESPSLRGGSVTSTNV